jgi:hypothetical protein
LVHHELRIAEELVVREPQDAEALLAEKDVAAHVMTALFPALVRRTIEFDDYAGRSAQEIDDVRCDRHLAFEFMAVQAAGAYLLPKQVLGAREHRALILGE